MAGTASWTPEVFDRIYAADPDPWRFTTSAYERDKYAATLAALPDQRFDDALEIGCSIGVFSRALAPRCTRLLGVDVAEAALAAARNTCGDLPHIRFERRRIPAEWPAGRYDLIVMSEVLYFLGAPDVERTARLAARDGALVLLVNWTGETDTPCTGDEAASIFAAAAAPELHCTRTLRAERYRIDLLARQLPVPLCR